MKNKARSAVNDQTINLSNGKLEFCRHYLLHEASNRFEVDENIGKFIANPGQGEESSDKKEVSRLRLSHTSLPALAHLINGLP